MAAPETLQGHQGSQALVHLRQPLLVFALPGERPAPPERAVPHILREPLRRRQRQQRLGLRLGRQHLAAALMQVDGQEVHERQTTRMLQRLGQGQGS